MLKDFKTEWNAIWKLSDGLKTGVVVKDIRPDIAAQLRSLKGEVGAYQQCVEAFNADKDGASQADLGTKARATLDHVMSFQSPLVIAFDMQIEANVKAPTGALQMPQDTPAAKFNPVLEKLIQQVTATISAMDVDLTAAGYCGDESAADQDLRMGVAGKAVITDTKYPAPSWLRVRKS